MPIRYSLIAAALTALNSAPLIAGVVVEVNGDQFTTSGSNTTAAVAFGVGAAPDITVTFASQITTTVNVRIYDSVTNDGLIGAAQNAQVPLAGIGRLTIEGAANSTGRLNILIADEDQAFPTALGQATGLEAGLTTFGGTLPTTYFSDANLAHDYDLAPWSSENTNGQTSVYDTDPVTPGFQVHPDLRGIIIPDPSLRRQTVLAAVVNGDICPGYDSQVGSHGRIEVGQVLRLSARRTDANGVVIGGDLNAHVQAVARDQYLTYGDINNPPVPLLPGQTVAATTTGFRAIENVTAGTRSAAA